MTGKTVRRIRRRLGLTQRQFAKLVGVHWNTIARWERDEKRITEPMSLLLRVLGKAERLLERAAKLPPGTLLIPKPKPKPRRARRPEVERRTTVAR